MAALNEITTITESVMAYQIVENNVYVNVSLRQTFSIILSTIQRGTSLGITSGNFGHYAISVRCFIESLSRQRSVREVTIGSKEGNISHCVFLSESQTTVWVVVCGRERNFSTINRYSFFEMRRAVFIRDISRVSLLDISTSLLAKSFSPRN